MPLSEDEQRILSEIEANLYETDPALARDIADTTVYTVASRHLKWGIFGLIAGLGMLIGGLWVSMIVLSFVGFLAMLLSAMAVESSLRKMGKASWEQLMQTMRADGMRDYFGDRSQRVRDRFRRDDEK
ncbi:MAG: DUF3040 domain-containing protein [Actinobacteria bacterium]|nr:DUF3040 domain-containing protein [Actinomycetota bacterium]